MATLREGKPIAQPNQKVTAEVYRDTLAQLQEAEQHARVRFEAAVASKLEWLEAQRLLRRWQWQFGPAAARQEAGSELKKIVTEELELVGQIRAAAFGAFLKVDIYDLHRDLLRVAADGDVAKQRQLLDQEVQRNLKSLRARYDAGVLDSIDFYSQTAEGLQVLLDAETLPTAK